VRGPEERPQANRGWLVRRFVARLRCGAGPRAALYIKRVVK
jgi:hypothetical protein